MKNFKKVTALTLAMSMVASSSFMALGADLESGSSSGTGEFEGTVNTDVFSVVLPTAPDGAPDTTYNFILDPEGLIKATAAAKYPGYTFDEGTLFFANDGQKYSNTSNENTIINKSTMAVDITLTATITAGEGVKINSDPTFENDTTPSMYMALTDGTNKNAANESGVAVLKTSIDPLADAYHIVYATDSNAYKFELKPDVTGFEEFKFALTGASNANGDWSQLETVSPKVDVVWEVAPKSDNVLTSDGTNDVVIHYEGAKPENVTITPIDTTGENKTAITMTNGDKVEITDEIVALKASWIATLVSSAARGTGTYKVTVNSTDYTITLSENTTDVLTSNGSNNIVIHYSGATPSSVLVTPIDTTGENKAAITMTNGDKVVITNKTVTLTTAWISTLMSSSARGTGTYKVTINSTDYTITLGE